MALSAQTSSARTAGQLRRNRRIPAGAPHPDARVARVAWQCLVLGILAFTTLHALSSAAASANGGGIWLLLAPVVSLIALYRHRLRAPWAQPAPAASLFHQSAPLRGLQARLPRRAASRLRRAA